MRVKDLAASIHGAWEGDGEREIQRVASLEDAAGGDALSFVTHGRAAKDAARSRAACLLVSKDYPNPEKRTLIRVDDPRAAAARLIRLLHPPAEPQIGIHPSAIVGRGAVIASSAYIGPLACIGAGAHIGEDSSIGDGCSVGERVHIGTDCVIHPRVTIYPDVHIGDSVILHSGCVIGADGFGFVFTGKAYEKFPQIGGVEIGNRVEIGANSCIDRAALGVTSIGEGTKLDNLVHVGHNCRIGRHVVVAAQTGFSGGVIVEDYAIIGGQVGIGDKVRIESRAVIGSGAGILTSKIVRAGQVVWGTPARPLKEYLAQLAVLSRLSKKKSEARGDSRKKVTD
jgi:UDP-3-O-[3-hydroxymyristoyl] glucosamine N-acyltransferase